ncbi:nicotinate-nucleotide--dimethylbenzimidazole phosphoribosyltransferase [Streptomyces uncialis]
MTDTGRIPGEALPDNAGEGVAAGSVQGRAAERHGPDTPGPYPYPGPAEPPADDDQLLMPGSQGAWSDTPGGTGLFPSADAYPPVVHTTSAPPVPVQQTPPPDARYPAPVPGPPVPEPAQAPVGENAHAVAPAPVLSVPTSLETPDDDEPPNPYEAEAPVTAEHPATPTATAPAPGQQSGAAAVAQEQTAEPAAQESPGHEPGPHETGGRDSGAVDLTDVRTPGAHAASAPGTARRPLHLGPPTPDTASSPVRSLSDRGPAGSRRGSVKVRRQAEQAPRSEPPQAQQTGAPEYLDAPHPGAPLPGPQLAEIPPQGGAPWGPAPGAPETQAGEAAAQSAPVAPSTTPFPPAPDATTAVPTMDGDQVMASPADTGAVLVPDAAFAAPGALPAEDPAPEAPAYAVAENPAAAPTAPDASAVAAVPSQGPQSIGDAPVPDADAIAPPLPTGTTGTPAGDLTDGRGLQLDLQEQERAPAAGSATDGTPVDGTSGAQAGPVAAPVAEPPVTEPPVTEPTGQFVPVEGFVPTTPHLAPTPPRGTPLPVPAQAGPPGSAPSPLAPAPDGTAAPEPDPAVTPDASVPAEAPAPTASDEAEAAQAVEPQPDGTPVAGTPAPDAARAPEPTVDAVVVEPAVDTAPVPDETPVANGTPVADAADVVDQVDVVDQAPPAPDAPTPDAVQVTEPDPTADPTAEVPGGPTAAVDAAVDAGAGAGAGADVEQSVVGAPAPQEQPVPLPDTTVTEATVPDPTVPDPTVPEATVAEAPVTDAEPSAVEGPVTASVTGPGEATPTEDPVAGTAAPTPAQAQAPAQAEASDQALAGTEAVGPEAADQLASAPATVETTETVAPEAETVPGAPTDSAEGPTTPAVTETVTGTTPADATPAVTAESPDTPDAPALQPHPHPHPQEADSEVTHAAPRTDPETPESAVAPDPAPLPAAAPQTPEAPVAPDATAGTPASPSVTSVTGANAPEPSTDAVTDGPTDAHEAPDPAGTPDAPGTTEATQPAAGPAPTDEVTQAPAQAAPETAAPEEADEAATAPAADATTEDATPPAAETVTPEPAAPATVEAEAPDGSAETASPEEAAATAPETPEIPEKADSPDDTPGAEQPSSRPAAPAYDDAERDAVLRVMRERRDIRNGFRPDPIPHEVLLRVLEAAHTAPSVGHSQPWDFVVIRSAETRQAMHELAERQRDAYARSLPKGRAKQFKELKIEAILDTPVNIVVTADPTRGGRHTLGRHSQPRMAPYSSALAVENLWLAARAEGLGVGWVSFFDEREMVRALDLPEHLEVVAYLCVGYVDEFPEEPELAQSGWAKRRPLSWVVHEETYGRRALPGEDPHDLLAETVAAIRPLDAKALGEAWERQKRMTKPAGALGMLEIISAQLSGLSRMCPPPIPEPAAVAVFAGDHGVHAQGVTPWPQEVTGQMVANFLGGGAVCNAFANQVGAEVCVIDVGVAADLPATPGLLPRKVRAGTGDMTTGPALTREEVKAAVEVGIETARDLVAAGNKALLTGEMGIANTTASAALIAVYTGADPAEVTGRGTGINDETLARKTDVVRRALDLHRPDPADPIGVLAAVGGLEHAALVGLILGGASLRTPVILDGVSAGAAALVARAVAPEALAACIAGHRSAEPGHVAALNKLGLRPLIDLDLRLGEGTGALLALPLVQSAARAMHEVATFDSAGVTEK